MKTLNNLEALIEVLQGMKQHAIKNNLDESDMKAMVALLDIDLEYVKAPIDFVNKYFIKGE